MQEATVHITPREKEVIVWLSHGKTAAAIAEFMGCARATVESHKHHVMTKMGAANVTAMVAMALREGIVQ